MTAEEMGSLIATQLLNGVALCGKLTDREAVVFAEEVIDAVIGHSHEALEAALAALREWPIGRCITILNTVDANGHQPRCVLLEGHSGAHEFSAPPPSGGGKT